MEKKRILELINSHITTKTEMANGYFKRVLSGQSELADAILMLEQQSEMNERESPAKRFELRLYPEGILEFVHGESVFSENERCSDYQRWVAVHLTELGSTITKVRNKSGTIFQVGDKVSYARTYGAIIKGFLIAEDNQIQAAFEPPYSTRWEIDEIEHAKPLGDYRYNSIGQTTPMTKVFSEHEINAAIEKATIKPITAIINVEVFKKELGL